MEGPTCALPERATRQSSMRPCLAFIALAAESPAGANGDKSEHRSTNARQASSVGVCIRMDPNYPPDPQGLNPAVYCGL
ncbi:hypothetical protein K466DRAFT_344401 [Polyporus arcularius HHB13444]|uniref:Uncharacterized protein n=1 Tax=Polyporus arcularius HHB13444 TaxID=1314778 RepID=A0A5C3NY23_9APHY|nr:hypothetical protein K466DRAFT_344401 [Polyporus arcularius HHB13444]